MGIMVNISEDEYQRYFSEYRTMVYNMMTWAQYCRYVEQQYYGRFMIGMMSLNYHETLYGIEGERA